MLPWGVNVVGALGLQPYNHLELINPGSLNLLEPSGPI
jgi:hypothetical protein